ncbi:hypothetical protein NLJ89_g2653 [Agrocybe chaxingu]|uniref:Xylanolytic transcriptional activator regulatory domain-containing protein n=1 Tax=Agrocybe chaxingu TaxID=84603 RepID=A0A9W8K6D9_9AGAR|nr:hypothetical protein NLJ89_g2653 [Agrocybe chaxingu]
MKSDSAVSGTCTVSDAPSRSDILFGVGALEGFANAIRAANDDDPFSQSDDEKSNTPGVVTNANSSQFFGRSSSEVLIREAVFTKKVWVEGESGLERPVLRNRREEFWTPRPWEKTTTERCHFMFPESDLAKDLLDLYFKHVNLHFPLLHRPSFERSLRDNLHRSNDRFGAVYLLSSSSPLSIWTMVGVALRSAQDIGVHRLRSRTPSAEDELWKRAFWVLIFIDRFVSTCVGRPCAIQDEELDLELPIDCDDEYWEHPDPEKRFRQPLDKPSTMCGFIHLLKLMYILNCCIRGLYAPPKGDVWYHPLTVQEWKPRVLMELDSSLNKWLDTVPEHLRWDPNRPNIDDFSISALLHALYYYVQILTHRPFISSPKKPSPLPFPSLTICTSAARACARIVDVQRCRSGLGPPSVIQVSAFTSTVVLLFGIWIRKGIGDSGSALQQDADDLELVEKCLEMLKESEQRWLTAGEFLGILDELSSMADSTRHICNAGACSSQSCMGNGVDPSLYPANFDYSALGMASPSSNHDSTFPFHRLAMETAQQPLSPILSSFFPFTFAYPSQQGKVTAPHTSNTTLFDHRGHPLNISPCSNATFVLPGVTLWSPQLCPDEKIYKDWIGAIIKDDLAFDEVHNQRQRPRSTGLSSISIPADYEQGLETLEGFAHAIRAGSDIDPYSQSDDESPSAPVVSGSLDSNRFFGKSSSEVLIREAIFTKQRWVGDERGVECPVLSHRREEFWALRPWERALKPVQRSHYTFPEPDLSKELLDLYFEHINLHFPLLHRPSFERSLRDNFQYSNSSFGAVYLLVCAIGARFSKDVRVLYEGSDSYHSAGWKWFNQVETGTISYLSLPSLYDLQLHCLTLLFLQSSSAPQAIWAMVGIVLRSAQDIGVHRLRSRTPSAEDELWKRAFWVLICIDRIVSTSVGRPCAIYDEDFDLDLPIDCDDEYWEHPDPQKRFKQPLDKPTTMIGFLLLLKLMYILNCCHRGFYAPPKGDEWYGPLPVQEWKSRIIMELDSSLNKWLDSVPEHLRWDPNRQHIQHFNISAMLYTLYHHIQILTHRLFISPRKPSVVPFPSLTICTNAARACVRIVDAQRKRNGYGPPPIIQLATFTSGVVLLFNSWVRKGTRGSTPLTEQDADNDMMLVKHCLEALKASEERWSQAARFWDMLDELSSVGDQSDSFVNPGHGEPRQPATDSIPATMASVAEGIDASRLATASRLCRFAVETAQPLSSTFSSLFSFTFDYPANLNRNNAVPTTGTGDTTQFEHHDQPLSGAYSWLNPRPGAASRSSGADDWGVYPPHQASQEHTLQAQ